MTTADRLTAAVSAGELLDLLQRASPELLDPVEMQDWDATHDVDADLLRQLLLNKNGDADPRGLRLRGARIRRRLDLDFVHTSVALRLEDCLLEEGVTAQQAHLPTIGMHRCQLNHPSKPAFLGDGLQVDGRLDLDEAVITANSSRGAVRLTGARVRRLSFTGADVRNPTGPAVVAEWLQTDGGVYLDAGFTAKGAGDGGAIRLAGAHINAQLRCEGATLRNLTGPALMADGLQTGGNVVLGDGFTAKGSGEDGTIRLAGTRIGDQLDLSGATLRNSTGPALVAHGLQTGGNLYLGRKFSADGAGDRAVIQISDGQINGQLVLLGCSVNSRTDPSHRWKVDGLTYEGPPQLGTASDPAAWLELLRTGTSRYDAQPYQQLAATCRAHGHDSDVRRILMTQRRDQIARGELNQLDRLWARTTGLLLGYGYQPWRALLFLAGVLATSVALTLMLAGQGLARTTTPTAATSAGQTSTLPCTMVQTIGRGLDLGAPFLPASPVIAGSCLPTATPAGDILTTIRWALQLAAWAMAALFIAGFTGIVRKT